MLFHREILLTVISQFLFLSRFPRRRTFFHSSFILVKATRRIESSLPIKCSNCFTINDNEVVRKEKPSKGTHRCFIANVTRIVEYFLSFRYTKPFPLAFYSDRITRMMDFHILVERTKTNPLKPIKNKGVENP